MGILERGLAWSRSYEGQSRGRAGLMYARSYLISTVIRDLRELAGKTSGHASRVTTPNNARAGAGGVC